MIELVLHRQTPTVNQRERWHWVRQRKEVKVWAHLAFYAMQGRIVPATVKRRVLIHSYRSQRCRDEENFRAGCKGLIDGLVRVKLLVDDSREWATFEYIESLASVSPTGEPVTIIQIHDEPPAIPATTKEAV